jgi:hypothetical protein
MARSKRNRSATNNLGDYAISKKACLSTQMTSPDSVKDILEPANVER